LLPCDPSKVTTKVTIQNADKLYQLNGVRKDHMAFQIHEHVILIIKLYQINLTGLAMKQLAKKLKLLSLAIVALMLLSCGGGSASEDSSSTQNTSTVTLNWSAPTQRLDGTELSTTDINGYVIIFFTESELDTQTLTSSLTDLPSAETFTSNPSIGEYINSYELPALITEGSPYAILITPGSSESYEFENLENDTYYFAISAYDTDNNYSELSETTSFQIQGN
jgi:hypothetical protein